MKRHLPWLVFGLLTLSLIFIAKRGVTTEQATGAAALSADPAAKSASNPGMQPAPAEKRDGEAEGLDDSLSRLLSTARVLDRRETPAPAGQNQWRRSQLIEGEFKYPLLQVEETWSRRADGSEERLSVSVQVADHAMMRFPQGLDRGAVEDWCTRQGYRVRRKLTTDDVYLVQVPEPALDATGELLRRFNADFGGQTLAVAEPDYLQFPDAVPDDAQFSTLWGLHNTAQSGGLADADIDGPEAWDLSTGNRSVVVGVIDTGLDRSHPDLAANIWTNPGEIAGNGLDDDANGFVDDIHGWDFYENDADSSDPHSHGTHCAGTIGAVGNNSSGVVGVNWTVSLTGLRFLGLSGGTTSDAIEAVNYSRQLGVSFTSNSWGGGGYNSLLEQAIQSAGQSGQLFIAAAGNSTANTDSVPHYPSSYNLDNIISVASTTRTDTLSSFSNYGLNSVDLGAPGSDILSTTPGNTYGLKSGTSMATPHVSGVAALIYSLSPNRDALEVKSILMQTGDEIPALVGRTISGKRLNARRAVEAVAGPRVLPSTITVSELAGNVDGIFNPGDTLAVDVIFRNVGSETAPPADGSMALEPLTAGVVLSGGPYPLGSLAPGASAPSCRFTVVLGTDLVTPLQVPLQIAATTATESWTKAHSLAVMTSTRIQGKILRQNTGEPIASAIIHYSGPRSGQVSSGLDGSYEIAVTDGTYSLQASATGYADSGAQSVTVPPAATDIDFHLGIPDLRVTPEIIEMTIASGDTASRTLELRNDGDVPLSWSALIGASSTLPSEHPAALDLVNVKIAMLSSTSHTTFTADMTARGATVSNIAAPLTAAGLAGFQVLVADDLISSLSASDIAALRTWVTLGGSLLTEGDNSSSITNINALLADSGIQQAYLGSFVSSTITDIVPHQITTNVASIYAGSQGAQSLLTGTAQPLARDSSGRVFAAISILGAGRILAIGNETTTYSTSSLPGNQLFINQAIGWLANSSLLLRTEGGSSGLIQPGASATLTLTVDAGGVDAGVYEILVAIATNDPADPQIEVPVRITVTGAPAITIEPASIDFGDVAIHASSSINLTISNTGSAALGVSAINSSDPTFRVQADPPLTLAPRGKLTIPVSFHPESPGFREATLTILSDDPTDPTQVVTLTARGIVGPQIAVSPPSFTVTLPYGTRRQETLHISNAGDTALNWELEFMETPPQTPAAADHLADTLVGLNESFGTVNSLVPNRYDFTNGVTGTYISDGGSDMYDSGNYLATSLGGSSNLSYSDGVIVNSAALGTGGRYFTRKYPGLFVFAAQTKNLASFTISGGLGADGSGSLSGAELVTTHLGRTYRGFVKRVYGAGDPSVNHLVIVEDRPGLSHSFPADTNSDLHTISGLGESTSLYYLLFASQQGGLIPDATMLAIMQAFLKGAAIAPGWVYADASDSGTTPAGGLTQLPFTWDATANVPGSYQGKALVHHNAAGIPAIEVPLTLHVEPAPVLTPSSETIVFPATALGSTRRQLLELSNTGFGLLQITPSLASADFTLPATAATISLLPGESHQLAIDFAPGVTGDFSAQLLLSTNLPAQAARQVALQGTGDPATLAVIPVKLDLTLPAGSTDTRSLTLTNLQAVNTPWTVSLDGAASSSPPLPDLSGAKVLFIGTESSYLNLRNRFIAAEATIRFVPYSSFTAADLADVELVFADSNFQYISDANATLLKNWCQAGGGLVLATESGYTAINRLCVGSGLSYASASYISSETISQFPPHVVNRGVNSLSISGSYHGLTAASPAKAVALRPGGQAFAAVAAQGQGRIVAIIDDIFTDISTAAGGKELDFAVRSAAWASKRTSDWLRVTPLSGTLAANGSSPLTVTIDASDLLAGTFHGDIVISSGLGPGQELWVPVSLVTTAFPDLEVLPGSVAFPRTYLGYPQEVELTLNNRGRAAATISSVDFPASGLTLNKTFPLKVPPLQSLKMTLRYDPPVAASFSGNLVIHSDDPDNPALALPASGLALPAPVIAAAPSPLAFTVASGSTATLPLTISNNGQSDLSWTIQARSPLPGLSLEKILAEMDANQAQMVASIPNSYAFSEGITGTGISDGGGDMYDGGNYLATNLAPAAFLEYSNGIIRTAPASLGPNGRYFTRKYSNLFVIAAELDGVSRFEITGNLGADGGGSLDGTTLTVNRGVATYRGFVKRVSGAGDPSVNHLIIVQDTPGLSHSFASSTGDDQHAVDGLAGTTRLFYLLYAGQNGGYIDNTQTLAIMETFLAGIDDGSAFWAAVPGSGTLAPGASAQAQVTVNAAALVGGTYTSGIEITSNDPATPQLSVPLQMTVIGTPLVAASAPSIAFADVFAGGQSPPVNLTISNPGSEVLSISSISMSAPFSVEATAPLSIPPGQNTVLPVRFTPQAVQAYQGHLEIQSNAANSPALTIPLSGSGIPAPVGNIGTPSLAVILNGSATATRPLALSNSGGSPLTWSTTVDFVAYGGGSVPDLAGVKIGTFLQSTTQYTQFTSRAAALGATVTALSYSANPDLAPYDALVIDASLAYFSTALSTQLRAWVQKGGCLLWANGYSSTPSTTLLQDSGLTFTYQGSIAAGIVTGFPPHPINAGITELGYTSHYLGLTVSGQARALATRPDGGTFAAVGNLGWGSIIAVADDFIDNQVYISSGNQLFLDRCLAWMGRRLRTWATFTPASGSTAVSGNSALTVNFDATGLRPGIYYATGRITTDSPVTPQLEIPFSFTVPANSGLAATPGSIAFPDTMALTSRSSTLRLTHQGLQPVTITALNATPPFSAGASTLPATLNPGDFLDVTVNYAPLAPGPSTGSFTVVSNAATPLPPVALAGTAFGGPKLSLPTLDIIFTRFAGTKIPGRIAFSNTGASPLNWTLDPRNATQFGIIPPDLRGLNVGMFATTHSSLKANLTAWGATTTDVASSTFQNPVGYNVLFADDSFSSVSSSYITGLRNWVNGGGTLILAGDSPSTFITRANSLLSGTGLTVTATTSTTQPLTQFAVHPLLTGISQLQATNCAARVTATGQAAPRLATLTNGEGHIGYVKIGSGQVLLICSEMFDDSVYNTGQAALLAANAFRLHGALPYVPWIDSSAITGILPPGQSGGVDLMLDTTNLSPGTYYHQVVLDTDDPTSGSIGFIVQFQVLPAIPSLPPVVDFGPVMIGDQATRTLTLTWPGPPQPVTPGIHTSGAFKIHVPASASVGADVPLVLPVTFAPLSEGADAATVMLSINEAPVAIQASGTGTAAGNFPIAGFTAWRNLHFAAGAPFSGMHDDPDGDGMDLATEYTFMRHPTLHDGTNPFSIVAHTPQHLRVRYVRRSDFPDSAILLKTSSDNHLSAWQAFVPGAPALSPNANGTTAVEFDLPHQGVPKLFLRASVGTN